MKKKNIFKSITIFCKSLLANYTYAFSLSCLVLFAPMLMAGNSYGQKYKIKKDVIYRDKEKVGRIYAEAEMPETNFTVSGLNGEKILTITREKFSINNPYSDSIYWYNVRFGDTNKEIKIDYAPDCGINCIVEDLLASNGIIISGGVINDQDEIIAQYDISEKIKNDTTEILNKHSEVVTLLRENEISRNLEEPVRLFKSSESKEGNTTVTIFNIVQDELIIGSIAKRQVEIFGEVRVDYDVYEKLYKPNDGKEDVPACKVRSTVAELELFTIVDGKNEKIELTGTYNAQIFLANYLVKNRYL